MTELEEIIQLKSQVALIMGLVNSEEKVGALLQLTSLMKRLTEKELGALHSVEKELRREEEKTLEPAFA